MAVELKCNFPPKPSQYYLTEVQFFHIADTKKTDMK